MRKRNFKAWAKEVETAIATRALMPWLIGDLLNYGEANYGERYAQALDERMVQYHTVQNWRWVCRQFSVSRRRETLSWSHHEAVASLSEKQQEKWLNLAERKGLSLQDLREAVREAGGKREVIVDERYATDFENWKNETIVRNHLWLGIKRGTLQVIGFDRRNRMPLVELKIKAA